MLHTAESLAVQRAQWISTKVSEKLAEARPLIVKAHQILIPHSPRRAHEKALCKVMGVCFLDSNSGKYGNPRGSSGVDVAVFPARNERARPAHSGLVFHLGQSPGQKPGV